MIYLFDDTNPQYISERINLLEFTDVIEYVSRASVDDILLMEPALREAEWIFVHKSFRDSVGGSKKVFEKVSYDIANDGDDVPLLWFSDEDIAEPHIDEYSNNFIDGYKKSIFYSRLCAFLEDRRKNKSANIGLLLYGEGLEQRTPVLIAEALLNAIRSKDGGQVMTMSDISTSDLMYLINISRPAINTEYASVVRKIENGEMFVKDFKDNIKRIADSFIIYGTNIYNWQ